MIDSITKVNGAHQELLGAVAGLDEQAWSQPMAPGKWSLKGMLGHLIYWNQWGLDYARDREAGKNPPGFGEDFEPINQQAASEWGNKDSSLLLAELDRIRKESLHLIAQSEGKVAWQTPEGLTTVAEWLASFAGHQVYHCKQIKEWRK